MADSDRDHWNERYEAGVAEPQNEIAPSRHLAPIAHLLPTSGLALDVACGRGASSLWLAARGLDVWGFDVSPVAIGLAAASARAGAVHAHFTVHDLDRGLPEGPAVDLILCQLFRDARLDQSMIDRLAPRGMLVVICLSEVGAAPGPFRTGEGELRRAFASLHVIDHEEKDGVARLVAVAAGPLTTTRLD